MQQERGHFLCDWADDFEPAVERNFQPLPQHRVDVKVTEAITDADKGRHEIQVLTKMFQHALG
jgi:hypothetical protein